MGVKKRKNGEKCIHTGSEKEGGGLGICILGSRLPRSVSFFLLCLYLFDA